MSGRPRERSATPKRRRWPLALPFSMMVVGLTTAAQQALVVAPIPHDCGTDLGCFEALSRTCSPAKMKFVGMAQAMGWVSGDAALQVVGGRSSGDCVVDLRMDQAVAPEGINSEVNRRLRCVLSPAHTLSFARGIATGQLAELDDLRRACRPAYLPCGGPDPRLFSGCSITPCEDDIRDVVCTVDGGFLRCPYSWRSEYAPGTARCEADGLHFLWRADSSACLPSGDGGVQFPPVDGGVRLQRVPGERRLNREHRPASEK